MWVRRESWRTDAKGFSSRADKIVSSKSSRPLGTAIGAAV
jgi:hypothetical protein